MKQNGLKIIICLFILFANNIFSQNKEFTMDRGIPDDCAECSPCVEGGVSENPLCTCFNKLVFQDADIHAVYALMADTAGINIVVDPELNIRISLKMENVSWCQFYSLLLDLYNLRSVSRGGYYYILSNDKYWTQKFGIIDNIKKEKQLQDKETRIFRIKNVSANKLVEPLQTTLSDNAEIVVDAESNSLIISDLPEKFPDVEAMIDSLDMLGKQIKITCQIVQIDKSKLDELGVNWQGEKVDGEVTLSANMNQVGGAGAAASMGNFTWGIISGEYSIYTRLSAIISEGKGRILDQPHIITMDNIQAEIFSGKQIPINTQDEAGNIITTMISVGTKLNVVPRITKGDKITLDLNIERSGYAYAAGGYELTTRSVKTTLNVDSGDVIVIGGLITNEKQETEYGVPLLKDLPLIGRLFRFESETVNTSVITLFITPEIL
ncbi:hypothetical protein DRQ33_02225 [bacterium]|nr:MAG: hypothetical protein DRQ33_02225 [bacterium]